MGAVMPSSLATKLHALWMASSQAGLVIWNWVGSSFHVLRTDRSTYGFGSSAKWRLSGQLDHFEGLVRAEGDADAPTVDGDVGVHAVEVAERGIGPR